MIDHRNGTTFEVETDQATADPERLFELELAPDEELPIIDEALTEIQAQRRALDQRGQELTERRVQLVLQLGERSIDSASA